MLCGFPAAAAKSVEPLRALVQDVFQQFACFMWPEPRATQNTVAENPTFLVWVKAVGQHVPESTYREVILCLVRVELGRWALLGEPALSPSPSCHRAQGRGPGSLVLPAFSWTEGKEPWGSVSACSDL